MRVFHLVHNLLEQNRDIQKEKEKEKVKNKLELWAKPKRQENINAQENTIPKFFKVFFFIFILSLPFFALFAFSIFSMTGL